MGSEGRLGLGFSEKLRCCLDQTFPLRLDEGFEDMKDSLINDTFKNAGCGKNINVVITKNGQIYTWGKPNCNSYPADYLETYSRP